MSETMNTNKNYLVRVFTNIPNIVYTESMNTKTSYVIIAILTVASFIIGFCVYSLLPAQIASHWGVNGEVNGFMPKFWGVFLMPLIMFFLSFLLFWLPKIDPLQGNVVIFRRYYNSVIVGIIFFLFYVHLLTIAWNIGFRFDMGKMIVPPIALLWYMLGVALPHIKQNWFMGIRTPWTLASVRVWDETHKWSGKLFRYSALISIAGFFFSTNIMFWCFIIPVIFSAIASVVYSYILFKKYGADKKG